MILQYVINKNQLILQHEIVKDVDSDNIYLDCQESGITLYRREQESLRFPRLTGESSVLKVLVDVDRGGKEYPELVTLKRFLQEIRSFELLTPEQMRASSRGISKSLSANGKNLPSFLKNMSERQRKGFLQSFGIRRTKS